MLSVIIISMCIFPPLYRDTQWYPDVMFDIKPSDATFLDSLTEPRSVYFPLSNFPLFRAQVSH